MHVQIVKIYKEWDFNDVWRGFIQYFELTNYARCNGKLAAKTFLKLFINVSKGRIQKGKSETPTNSLDLARFIS